VAVAPKVLTRIIRRRGEERKNMSEKDRDLQEGPEAAAEENAEAEAEEPAVVEESGEQVAGGSSEGTAGSQKPVPESIDAAGEPEPDGDAVSSGEPEAAEASETKESETGAAEMGEAADKGPSEVEETEAVEAAETDASKAEEPEDTGPPKKWYVVHTYSGHENKVKDNIKKMINTSGIQDHFGKIIVPTEEVAEMKKGKKTITTRKFFPSYILIEMHMSDESRHLVSDIPGVTSFVGTTSGPQPLSHAEVERIMGRMDKEKQTIIPDIPFTLGEHIRIKDGPFSDFTGVIDEINAERGKLKVLVSIFGRETPVELDFLQVENL
jgi:transcriptional antiterminator NusG